MEYLDFLGAESLLDEQGRLVSAGLETRVWSSAQ